MKIMGAGTANGKFGELLQGQILGKNNHFLISLPIELKTTVNFRCDLNEKRKNIIIPQAKIKSEFLCQKILNYFGINCSWTLEIISRIPEGKGLGSSTADLVATARAIEHALGKKISAAKLSELLTSIEPTDGLMYDEIVCFLHRKGMLRDALGELHGIAIVGIDEGGIVDTVAYNDALLCYTRNEKKYYSFLLEKMISAIRKRDIKEVGKLATESAFLNQKMNYKKSFDYLAKLSKDINALGINVAHSGTYIGVILDTTSESYGHQLDVLKKALYDFGKECRIFKPYYSKVNTAVSYV